MKVEMSEGTYRLLVWAAVATFVFVVGSVAYQYLTGSSEEGNLDYRRANLRLEDGAYQEALNEFDIVLRDHPEHAPSYLGRAIALMALGQDDQAMQALDTAVSIEPTFAAAYANRGILHDRHGEHAQALTDYRQALKLDPKLGEGPGWLTRFFRLQYQRPPTIADRADYLARELAKPPGERTLSVPKIDSKQRMYKVEGLLDDDK